MTSSSLGIHFLYFYISFQRRLHRCMFAQTRLPMWEARWHLIPIQLLDTGVVLKICQICEQNEISICIRPLRSVPVWWNKKSDKNEGTKALLLKTLSILNWLEADKTLMKVFRLTGTGFIVLAHCQLPVRLFCPFDWACSLKAWQLSTGVAKDTKQSWQVLNLYLNVF